MAAFIDLMAFQRGAELANAANWRDVIQNIATQTQQQNLSQKQMEFGINLPVAEAAAKTRAGALNDLYNQQQANQALAAFEAKVLSESARLPQAERAQYIADAARARMQEAGSSPVGQAETRALGGWLNTLAANAWKGGAGDQRTAQIYASASPFGVSLVDMRNGGGGGRGGGGGTGVGGTLQQQGQASVDILEAALRNPNAPLYVVTPDGQRHNVRALRATVGLNPDGSDPLAPAGGTRAGAQPGAGQSGIMVNGSPLLSGAALPGTTLPPGAIPAATTATGTTPAPMPVSSSFPEEGPSMGLVPRATGALGLSTMLGQIPIGQILNQAGTLVSTGLNDVNNYNTSPYADRTPVTLQNATGFSSLPSSALALNQLATQQRADIANGTRNTLGQTMSNFANPLVNTLQNWRDNINAYPEQRRRAEADRAMGITLPRSYPAGQMGDPLERLDMFRASSLGSRLSDRDFNTNYSMLGNAEDLLRRGEEQNAYDRAYQDALRALAESGVTY